MMTSQDYRPRRAWEYKKSDLSTLQKREAKALLWGLAHEKNCFFCRVALDPRRLYDSFTIHHELPIGMEGCNMVPVLHLAHLGCNSRFGKAKGIQKQRERNNAPEVVNPTEQLREVVDYSQGSTEMQVNNQTEVPFAKWLKRELLLKGPMEYKEALDRGAYAVGCGQQAIRRHIDKLIGGKELKTFKDANTRKKMVKLMAKGEENL